MAVAVNQPRAREKQEDPLDTIIKGLSIASTVYGIKDASEKRDLLAKQNALNEERLNQQGDRDTQRLDLEQQRLDLEKKKANQEFSLKSKAASDGSKLPASEAVSLGSANSAYQALGDAGKVFEANQSISGPIQGRISSIMASGEFGDTGKRAKSFDAQMKANAQIIGKSLEGGKLTDQDIERYKQMLPNLNDSADAAKDKIAILQNMLSQKQRAEASALGQAGYNVGKIQTSAPTENPNLAKMGGITPEDAQAELIRRKGIGAMLPKKPGRN